MEKVRKNAHRQIGEMRDHPLQSHGMGIELIHTLPCRFRLAVFWVKNQPERASWLQSQLAANESVINGVQVRASTGNVLISTVKPVDFCLLQKLIVAKINDFNPDSIGVSMSNRKDSRARSVLPTSNWHAVTLTKAYEKLNTDEKHGLSSAERRERSIHFGRNCYDISTKLEHLKIVKDQLFNIPVAMLCGSALLSVATGGFADAVLILAVVGINGAIGYRTSLSAERAINSLGMQTRGRVKVFVDSIWQDVAPSDLVPGDIIKLETGMVPADCLVVYADGLTTDESSLTGEGCSCYKFSDVLPIDTPLAERHNMLFAGTVITGGQCIAFTVATGGKTEIGKIRTLTAGTVTRSSQLQNQLDSLGQRTVAFAGLLCSGFFIIGLVRGVQLIEMLRISISLAVAAIPEGLTAVGTLSFAFGIKRMQHKNIFARDLRAIENIGNIHYFCLDKTGTVTANRMEVSRIWIIDHGFSAADLQSFKSNRSAPQLVELTQLLQAIALCSDAEPASGHSQAPVGSPTEVALLDLAEGLGINIAEIRAALPRIGTQYRTFNRRYMASKHQMSDGAVMITMKGDPDLVLNTCRTGIFGNRQVPLSEIDRQNIRSINSEMAATGLRVLGFASGQEQGEFEADNNCWLGLIGISDPPRAGVHELIQRLHTAGIKTMLITGDQLPTAISIAKDLGFNGSRTLNTIDSIKLKEFSPATLLETVPEIQVFARVNPEEKLMIIQGLQGSGFTVAMTGDGVNDSPALRAADVGIAMGKSGSSAARETADIVIGDDRLLTMTDAIIEGRAIRKNLQQATKFLLTTNYAEMTTMMIGLLLQGRSALSAVQLLWVNVLTDIFPALALAAKPATPDLGREIPARIGSGFFTDQEMKAMTRDSVIMSIAAIPHFFRSGIGNAPDCAATEFLTTLVTSQMAYAWSLSSYSADKSLQNSEYHRQLLGTLAGTWLLQLVLPYIPRLSGFLGLGRMTPGQTATSIGLGILPAMISEVLVSTQHSRLICKSAEQEV